MSSQKGWARSWGQLASGRRRRDQRADGGRMVAELRAGSRFPGEGGDVGVAQPQRGRRWDRGQPTRERAGGVKSRQRVGEHACRCVSATLGSAQGRGQGQGRGEGGAASKAGSHSPRPGELWMRLGRGAALEPGEVGVLGSLFQMKSGVPDVSTGRGRWVGVLERSLEVRQARPRETRGSRWSVHVGHGH